MSDVSPIRLIGREPLASIGQPQVPLAKRPDFDLAGTRVYPSRLLLEGPTSTLPLERRVMEVLLAFVDADGAVLSRSDLVGAGHGGLDRDVFSRRELIDRLLDPTLQGNPADDHTKGVFDEAIRGKTDRFTHLYRKK